MNTVLEADHLMTGSDPRPFSDGVLALRVAVLVGNTSLKSEVLESLRHLPQSFILELPPESATPELMDTLDRESIRVLVIEAGLIAGSLVENNDPGRESANAPVVFALHTEQEPAEIIRALRSGASEFLCPPLAATLPAALERAAAQIESHESASAQKGKMLGFVSAKGGCGATAVACYLAAALPLAFKEPVRALLLELDGDGAAEEIYGVKPGCLRPAATLNVERFAASGWRNAVVRVSPKLDLLTGINHLPLSAPESCGIDALFASLSRAYSYVAIDLGRQIHPRNIAMAQNVDELFVISCPDVLSLYQTRSLLQTLATRGFDKSRIRLILNQNVKGKSELWKESVEQMFELPVFHVLPRDECMQAKYMYADGGDSDYPADTELGRQILKLASKIARVPPSRERGWFRRLL